MNDGLLSNELGRREFVKVAAKTFLGVSAMNCLPAFAGAEAAKLSATADSLIYIFLPGGMSQFETFCPSPITDVQGDTQIIRSATGWRVSEFLPHTAKVTDHLAIVQSLKCRDGGHGGGQYHMRTGFLKRSAAEHPHIGSWVLRMSGTRNPHLPGFVGHDSAGFLGARFAGIPATPEKGLEGAKNEYYPAMDRRLALAELVNNKFRERYGQYQLVKDFDAMYENALTYVKYPDLKAFDISQEDAKTRARYGKGIGPSCLLARRLVESGVRVVSINFGTWDHHWDLRKQMGSVHSAGGLDQGFGALISDLHERGMLKRTLVVLTTEFGRTPEISRGGRNHYPPAGCCVLAGGGVLGGQIYGKTNKRSTEITENPVRPEDLNSTIAHAMGIDHTKEVFAPSGRPFKIRNVDGKPVTGLFG